MDGGQKPDAVGITGTGHNIPADVGSLLTIHS